MAKVPTTKDLIDKIEKIAKERIAKSQVVSLAEFRNLKKYQTPLSLLVIEDDETMREALRRIFVDEGYIVMTASDGLQLVTVLENHPIDLIILDIGLPWVNGFELAELMKSHEALQHIPLVFVSGRSSEADIKRAFKVGADDYIKKPFDILVIKKAVNVLLQLKK